MPKACNVHEVQMTTLVKTEKLNCMFFIHSSGFAIIIFSITNVTHFNFTK